MSTITVIQSTDIISDSRSTINTNFSNLNTDKVESSFLSGNYTTTSVLTGTFATSSTVSGSGFATLPINASTIGVGQVTDTVFGYLAGITSSVVSINNIQTLSNKTLVTPSIASFAQAAHTHQNGAGGGLLNASSIFSMTGGQVKTSVLGTGTASAETFLSGDSTYKTVSSVTGAAQPAITSAVNLPWTGLAPGTDGQIPTFDSSGNPAFVTTGNLGQILTSNGAGAAPTFQDASGGSTPEMKMCTMFETSTRFTLAASGGTNTFGVEGLAQTTTATGTRYASAQIALSGAGENPFTGSPTFTCMVIPSAANPDSGVSSYYGIGAVAVTGSGHTYTNRHAGFKLIGNGSTLNVIATQADNTTEAASATLTTVDQGDSIELIAVVNGTASVDYYWRKNGGALSAATNIATNMPTGGTSTAYMQFSVSNNDIAATNANNVRSASYER